MSKDLASIYGVNTVQINCVYTVRGGVKQVPIDVNTFQIKGNYTHSLYQTVDVNAFQIKGENTATSVTTTAGRVYLPFKLRVNAP